MANAWIERVKQCAKEYRKDVGLPEKKKPKNPKKAKYRKLELKLYGKKGHINKLQRHIQFSRDKKHIKSLQNEIKKTKEEFNKINAQMRKLKSTF